MDMFATVHNTHFSQFMSPVLELRALAIDALSQDWQGKRILVHVSTISPAQQSHSEAQDHLGGPADTNSPLVAVTTVVSTSYNLHTWSSHAALPRSRIFDKRGL